MKFLIFPLVALSFSSAFAVSDAGTRGGGNAVICFNDTAIPVAIRKNKGDIKNEYIAKISSIEMLDIYEVKLAQGMDETTTVEIKDVQSGEGLVQFSNRLLERFRLFTPDFYKTAMKMTEQMPPDRAFAHPYGIENVNDFNLSGRIDTNNCVVGTVLSHTPNGPITDIHYDQRLWNHPAFGSFNKHVAYLHEVVYRTYRETMDMEASSDKARRIVGLLLKKTITHAELSQQMESVMEWNFEKSSNDLLTGGGNCVSVGYELHCNLYYGKDVADFYKLMFNPDYKLDYKGFINIAAYTLEVRKTDPVFQKFQKYAESYGESAAWKKLSLAETERVHCLLQYGKCLTEGYFQKLIDIRKESFALHRKYLAKFISDITKSGYFTAQQISNFQNKAEAVLDRVTTSDHRKAALEAEDRIDVRYGAVSFDFSDLTTIKNKIK